MSVLGAIEAQLLGHQLPFGGEIASQLIVGGLLEQLGLEVIREYPVSGARGRIDFYLPREQVGIELKVKGSPSEVVRQLQRYAAAPEVAALMLVTGRAALGASLPSSLAGKPLRVVCTWRGGL